MENYVFFIGGTGARVLRSFLHLCASGAMSEKVEKINLILLDVDSENHACTEAKELYDLYQERYSQLQYARDKLNDEMKIPAFQPCLEMPSEGAFVINPITDAKATLDSVAVDSKRALEWLYTEGERKQSLKQGFFARPNIGCLFFNSVRSALLPYVDSIVGALASNADVRIAIVGSMFGGTGAAGIPTILRVIRDECCKKMNLASGDRMEGLHFGGILVTPYFKFKNPSGATENLPIRHNAFFGNTRSALEYYNWNYKEQFERVYLAGQDILQFVTRNGEYVDGGKEQRNKPHIVELIAAMGVRHFLTDNLKKGPMNIYEMILQSEGHAGEPLFGWDTLEPELSAIGDMLRAQTLLNTVISSRFRGEVWQWSKAFHMNRADNQTELNKWLRYTNKFLDWMYNLQYQWSEPDGDSYAKDSRVSLAGRSIETVRDRKKLDVARDFADLIENRTNAANVNYQYADGRRLLAQLGARGVMARNYGALGMTGLFIQLFDLASEKA